MQNSAVLFFSEINKSLKEKKAERRWNWNILVAVALRSMGTSNSRESYNLSPDDVNGQFCFLGGTNVLTCASWLLHIRSCCTLRMEIQEYEVACSPTRWNESTRLVSPTTPVPRRWSNVPPTPFHLLSIFLCYQCKSALTLPVFL